MNPNDLEQLTARLARLESFNRRLSRATAVLLLVLASAAWMGLQKPAPKTQPRKKAAPSAPQPVEAVQFVLKSPSGQVLATLGMTDGGPMLRLVGPNGTDRARLGLDATGTPRLVMLRADGSVPVTVALTPDGLPRLELNAPDKSAARMVVGSDGPGLGLVDAAGVVRLALDLKPDGPVMTLVDKNKMTRASFNVTEKAPPELWGPNLVMFDEEGKSRAMLSVRPALSAFNLQDSLGKVRAGLEVRRDNPAFALYGPNDKPLFVKP